MTSCLCSLLACRYYEYCRLAQVGGLSVYQESAAQHLGSPPLPFQHASDEVANRRPGSRLSYEFDHIMDKPDIVLQCTEDAPCVPRMMI